MTKYERILEALKDMDAAEIVSVWNEYCSSVNRMDDYVYSMNEFDEICDGMKPWEVARACFYGEFSPCDDYFRFNGYGNFESFDYWEDEGSPISLEEIAEWCDENDDALYSVDIEEAIAGEDEEEEEEEEEGDE